MSEDFENLLKLERLREGRPISIKEELLTCNEYWYLYPYKVPKDFRIRRKDKSLNEDMRLRVHEWHDYYKKKPSFFTLDYPSPLWGRFDKNARDAILRNHQC